MHMQNAFLGSLVADALAMPVHWYYDVEAMDSDYGPINGYLSPHNPHPNSILWRSHYNPASRKADILHGQKIYWGKRGIHYHQNLQAGENTLNLQLASELYRHVISEGIFKIDNWLKRYIEVMLTPNWHNDTYVEEYHRTFFLNYERGIPLRSCGAKDLHIGALSMIPSLLAGLEAIGKEEISHLLESVFSLVSATHNHTLSIRTASDFSRILVHLSRGFGIRDTLSELPIAGVSVRDLKKWEKLDDRFVVGEKLSTACYLPQSFLAALHFAWKYHDDFQKAIVANAESGGDSCHRGVVVGSIVASQTGIPDSLINELRMMENLKCDLHKT